VPLPYRGYAVPSDLRGHTPAAVPRDPASSPDRQLPVGRLGRPPALRSSARA
jgi:hypothetical protein